MSPGAAFGVDAYRGLGVALVTPFRDDGRVDADALREHAEGQVRAGVDVLVPCGSTGEAPALTADEHERVVAEAVAAADGEVPVMAGAAGASTREALARARAARTAGADAILAGTPPYVRPSQDGLYAHFRAVAEEVSLPVFVYNVPGRTGVNLAPETVLRLAGTEGIRGVKEASGDLSQIMTLLAARPPDFLVLAGDDELAVPTILLGGDGVISVAANERPREMARMVDAGLADRRAEAVRLHFRLLDLMRANFVEPNPIPVKAALASMGRMSGAVRLPLLPISDRGRARVEGALAALDVPAEAS